MNTNTKKLTALAMICTIAYLVMVMVRIPVVLFLKYDPKDVIITIGGFLFGPMSAFMTSILVALVEMFTVSDTGIIGCIMNALATCSFACTASLVYKKMHTIKGAAAGLIAGCLSMTFIMILWNYLITPLYMGIPREEVVKLLIPAFLPFNLLKGGLNAAATMLIYKPVVLALRRADVLPPSECSTPSKTKVNTGAVLVSSLVLATCILLILVLQGIL